MKRAAGRRDIESFRCLRKKNAGLRNYQVEYSDDGGNSELINLTHVEFAFLFSEQLTKFLEDLACEEINRDIYSRLNIGVATESDESFGNRDITYERIINIVWLSDGRRDGEKEGRFYARDAATMRACEVDMYILSTNTAVDVRWNQPNPYQVKVIHVSDSFLDDRVWPIFLLLRRDFVCILEELLLLKIERVEPPAH